MIGITESPEGVALALVQFIVQRAASSTDHRLCRVALSGGSTPRRLYEMLARPPWRDQVDWARIEVFWSDERCVPPDDPASNYRMAREALLEQVPIHPAHIHRILGELPPDEAAAAYERTLRKVFRGRAPRFDILLLGMGVDGHTASLFPGTPAIHETMRWVAATEAPTAPHARITLTPVALSHAVDAYVLVTGAEKADMVRTIFKGPRDPDRYPAQLLIDSAYWIMDEAAAARFREP